MDSILSTLRTQITGGQRLVVNKSWAGYGKPLPADFFGRLYYLRSGAGKVTHHDKTFQLRPGWLTVIPAFTPCCYVCYDKMDLSYIHFTSSVLGSLEPFAFFQWPFEVKVKDIKSVNGIWNDLLAAANSDILDADGLFRRLLAYFQSSAPKEETRQMISIRKLQPVFNYVEQHLASEITLADLAKQVNLQSTYFSNFFTEIMGVSPMSYVIRLRIEKAQALLRNTDQKLQAISEAVGYSDVFYFSRIFKQTTGMPPSQYRRHIPI